MWVIIIIIIITIIIIIIKVKGGSHSMLTSTLVEVCPKLLVALQV